MAALLVGVVSALALILGANVGTAQAESFTYWSLWVEEDGKWTPAQTGAADIKLTDQSVVAAKYLTSEVDLTDSDAPKDQADYEALCPDAQPQEGQTRVGVVLDFGDASLATDGQTPPGNVVECVYVASPATAATALDANASVTQNSSGFIEAINGYPGTGEGTIASSDPVPEDTEGSTPWAWIIGVTALIVIAILVGMAISRRKTDTDSGDSGV